MLKELAGKVNSLFGLDLSLDDLWTGK